MPSAKRKIVRKDSPNPNEMIKTKNSKDGIHERNLSQLMIIKMEINAEQSSINSNPMERNECVIERSPNRRPSLKNNEN